MGLVPLFAISFFGCVVTSAREYTTTGPTEVNGMASIPKAFSVPGRM
jgi:hypothetical protein